MMDPERCLETVWFALSFGSALGPLRFFLVDWVRKRLHSPTKRGRAGEAREKNPAALWIWKPINLSASTNVFHGLGSLVECHNFWPKGKEGPDLEFLLKLRLRQGHPTASQALGAQNAEAES